MRTKQGAKAGSADIMNVNNACLNPKDSFDKQNFLSIMRRTSTFMSFTIEQWELMRRLRNSGLTKDQICQAYDDIERVERDLGNVYNVSIFANNCSTNELTNVSKANNGTSNAKVPNGLGNGANTTANELTNGALAGTTASAIINSYFSNVIEPEKENRELANFRSRGEIVNHNEISAFVTKHDLKQSQIARMAGVNQAYVSKFLRGDFVDLSENGKSLIYKWYKRFLMNPTIFLQTYNINLNTSSNISIDPKAKTLLNPISVSTYSYPNISNLNYETPKRTRFSFKPEHLVILEKSFLENQYPDQKRREELAKLCNDARPCLDREKVSEQIITHWFQNKRKITRKSNNEDKSSTGGGFGSSTNGPASNLDQINFDFIDDYKSPSKSNDEDDEDVEWS